MNYIGNFFWLIYINLQLLAQFDLNWLILLSSGGLIAGLTLSLLAAYFGKLFFKPFSLSSAQLVACVALTLMVTLTFPAFAAARYLQPSLERTINDWRDRLNGDTTWQQDEFVRQYHEIRRQKLEDFSQYPPPEQGGNIIPMNNPHTIITTSTMTAEAAIGNFNSEYPLLAFMIGVTPTISSETVSNDVNNFFSSNQGGRYPHTRGIALAVNEISQQMTPRIHNVIFWFRLLIASLPLIFYVVCLTWISLSALGKIHIFSAHRSIQKSS